MKIKFIQYLFSSIILIFFGILIFDNIILPSYVGYNNEVYLPDIRGEYLYKGKKILNDKKFKVEVIYMPYNENNTAGTIIKMFPRAFTKVKNNRIINLTVAGHQTDIITPDFIGLTLRNAKIQLDKFDLKLDTVLYEFNSSYDNNLVSFQMPKKGHLIKSGNKIILGVSKGNPPDYYIVPDLVGKSLQSAKALIVSSGLRLGIVEYEYHPNLIENTVVEQNLTEGMRVSFPSKINLILSKDKEL